jgi:hypothetical protein
VALLLLAVLVGACRTAVPGPPPRAVATPLPCGDATVTLTGPADDVARVRRVLPSSCALLVGAGLVPVGAIPLRIHTDVDGFVAATGRVTDTLRAWSTVAGIDLLTLASWHRQDDEAVRRRVAHEVCHVALFRRTQGGRAPPRALAEGLCSVVAGQEDERLPLDEVRARARAGEPLDFDGDSAFAYGVAHHVVDGIWRCRGPGALLAAVDAIATGVEVAAALGAPPLAFLDGCPGSGPPAEALHSPP